MNKLRYIYGFLILIILFGGFLTAEATGLFPDNTKPDYSENVSIDYINVDYSSIEGKGLAYPRGKRTIGEIMHAYNLTKEELYGELCLPSDLPESSTVINLIKSGLISSKQVQAYMTPITKEFEE